ncbi:MAG: PAS domain S-box protein [Candidatus Fermentibacteraceae bacterium]|nr:PAS domain S-box protein [Candidatus Fermentibacteraceae bacterium]MBN2608644.1 PAS domain S-box protein [Candidatus Fermentibacteraceae bacterium]
MEESDRPKEELLKEPAALKGLISERGEQGCACPVEGLNTEECVDFLSSIISAITEPILILDSGLKCVFSNRSFTEMFGIEPDTVKGESVYSIGDGLLNIRGLKDLLDELLSIHRDFDGYEANLNLLNVGERIMSLNATDVHQKTDSGRLLLLSFIDMTEQKKAEKKQREDEERYRSLFENSRDAIMTLEPPDWLFTAGNPSTIRMFQCRSEADFTSHQPWKLSPEYQPDGQISAIKAKDMIDRAMENGSNFFEWTHRRVTGEEFPATVLLSRIEIRGKQLLQATVRDITGRKQVEEELANHRFHLEELVKERTAELEESERKYRILVEQSHDGIYIYGGNRFLFVNDRVCDITRYSREELLEMEFDGLLHPDDRERINRDGTAGDGLFEVPNVFQLRLLRKDGDVRNVEFSVREISYGGEEAVLGVARDITDIKKLEEEQKRIEKLESVGLLAGGIAHDFNNFLTAIMGNISLARTMVEPGSDLYEILTSSEHATSKASNLTRQLLTFSRGGNPIKKSVSVDSLLREAAAFVLSGSNVTADFDFPPDLPKVTADSDQMVQVFSNIIINSCQAMPEGGRVHISAESYTVGDGKPSGAPQGQYVRSIIKDDGYGIQEEHLSRLFDPFFTTKQNGTGLGLATAYSIIRKHGGHISVDTEVGKGTAFIICLPVSSEVPREKPVELEHGRHQGGRILIMDDQEMIRETAGSILRELGYEVESAANGKEAIEKYRLGIESLRPYDAVILDLTIPDGMGGTETMQELLKLDPHVKAVVSSGYSNAVIMDEYARYGFSGVMTKPYSINQLSDLLSSILSG